MADGHNTMDGTLHIDTIPLQADRPLVICDADEVLFQFVPALEVFLEERGLWLDLVSYRLNSNIKDRTTNEPLPGEQIPGLIDDFFAARTHALDPVPGAAEALADIAVHAQVVVLTNIPEAYKSARAEALIRHAMPYPVLSNGGLKGPAVKSLATRAGRPAIFIDDTPYHHISVQAEAADVHLVHFVHHAPLRAVTPDVTIAHATPEDWAEIRDTVINLIHGSD